MMFDPEKYYIAFAPTYSYIGKVVKAEGLFLSMTAVVGCVDFGLNCGYIDTGWEHIQHTVEDIGWVAIPVALISDVREWPHGAKP